MTTPSRAGLYLLGVPCIQPLPALEPYEGLARRVREARAEDPPGLIEVMTRVGASEDAIVPGRMLIDSSIVACVVEYPPEGE